MRVTIEGFKISSHTNIEIESISYAQHTCPASVLTKVTVPDEVLKGIADIVVQKLHDLMESENSQKVNPDENGDDTDSADNA